jgi:Trk K+ transport system NAD-binding subunit
MTQHHPSADDRPDSPGKRACYVLGDGHLGTAVARHLRSDGHAVSLVDVSDWDRTPGLRAVDTAQEAGVAGAPTAVVATRSDRRNLLVAQLVSAHYDVPRAVVLANASDRLDAFTRAGHDPVCATAALSDALAENV